MNLQRTYWLAIGFLFIVLSCSSQPSINNNETKIKITTSYGNMVLKLYNETPNHRDNFIKLVKEGYYNELLFHRVIQQFMIQGGDPDSKNAPAKKRLGKGGPGYQLDAEFVDTIYHKKGVIAAAREGDRKNPLKKSDGSQFYLVQGKIFSTVQIDELEFKMYMRALEEEKGILMKKYKSEMIRLQNMGDIDRINELKIEVEEKADAKVKSDSIRLTKRQKQIYTTIGGTPHLDGAYTVFGEIIEGLSILDSIAAVKVDKNNRPLENVSMQIELVE